MKFVIIFVFLINLSVSADSYYYTDISSGDIVEFNLGNNKIGIRYPDDVLLKAENCLDMEFKVCFFSSKFSLAIPQKIISGNTWCIKSICYHAKSYGRTIKIFDKVIDDIYIIESPNDSTLIGRQKGKLIYWYYSQKHGVLAFQYSDDQRFFLSRESYGFANDK